VVLEDGVPITIRTIFTGSDARADAVIDQGRIIVTVENFTNPLGQYYHFDFNRGELSFHVKLMFYFIGEGTIGMYSLTYTVLQ
jgi:hypothetical protein